jgi:hypothetical protein
VSSSQSPKKSTAAVARGAVEEDKTNEATGESSHPPGKRERKETAVAQTSKKANASRAGCFKLGEDDVQLPAGEACFAGTGSENTASRCTHAAAGLMVNGVTSCGSEVKEKGEALAKKTPAIPRICALIQAFYLCTQSSKTKE